MSEADRFWQPAEVPDVLLDWCSNEVKAAFDQCRLEGMLTGTVLGEDGFRIQFIFPFSTGGSTGIGADAAYNDRTLLSIVEEMVHDGEDLREMEKALSAAMAVVVEALARGGVK